MKAALSNPEVLSLGLLSCLFVLLPVLVPASGELLTLCALFPLVVLAVKYPWRYAVSLLTLEGGFLLLGGRPPLLFFLGQQGLVALVMAGAIRRGWSISRTIVGSLLVSLGVGTLFLLVYSTLRHGAPPALLTRYAEKAVSMSQEYLRALEYVQEDGDEQLTTLKEALPQLVVFVLPALVVISHLGISVLNYLLVRRYCQRSQPPLALAPDDLACWRASDYLVWVFVASGVAVLLPVETLSIIGMNVLLVTLAIYCLQGVAIVLFWGRRLPMPRSVQYVIGAMVFLFAGPLCLVVCTAAGLFDLWVDFRRQRYEP